MAVAAVQAETRIKVARVAATAGAVAVVAAGLPALEREAERQADDHEWRMKARALVTADIGDAPVEETAQAVLAERVESRRGALDRLALSPFQTFAPAHFDHAERQRRDHECLSRAIYYESRNEAVRGQLAVAEVVLNRVRHRLYPNSVCGVVYEGSHRKTGCQFTFTCDGAEARAPYGRSWRRARVVAAHALMDLSSSVTNDATHYHANYVDPHWAPRLVHTRTIGTHIFYRFPQRGERTGRRGA